MARFAMAALQFFTTPLIVALLGPEKYGLVGFGVVISMFLTFLDQGVSPVLARELARWSAAPGDAREVRDLLRSLEAISLTSALLIGGTVALSAPLIARYGLTTAHTLPEAEIVAAIRLTGLWIAVQWPAMLYAGGFVGLQRQHVLVAIRVLAGAAATIGGVAILWLWGPSVGLFLGWQALVSAGTSMSLGLALWGQFPASAGRPRVRLRPLQRVWRFAAGSLLIGLTSVLLTQAPGLIVAKYSTLAELAAYTLALSLAQQLATLPTQPVIASLMPHFVQLIERGDEAAVAREYHRWTQIIAALILPLAAMLAWLPHPLLQLWLGTASPLVGPVSALLPWTAIATALNTLVTPPYLLQIASGWTRLSLLKNILAVAVALPLLLLLVPRAGALAAVTWLVALNLGYYLIEVPIMHRRLLRTELLSWWLADTLAPMVTVASVFTALTLWLPHVESRWLGVALSAGIAALACCALLVVLPLLRSDVLGLWRRLRTRPSALPR